MNLNKDKLNELMKEAVTQSEASRAQLEAGNYKKQHRVISGIRISIENPLGSSRSGVSRSGVEWKTLMYSHYGYIKGTVGKDKDHLDCFIRKGVVDGDDIPHVWIVNQIDPSTGKLDEHKVMIGWDTAEQASAAYLKNYDKGWKGLGSVAFMRMADFKVWMVDRAKTKKPAPNMEHKMPKNIVSEKDWNEAKGVVEKKYPKKKGGDFYALATSIYKNIRKSKDARPFKKKAGLGILLIKLIERRS